MDPKTGQIVPVVDEDDARRRGLVPIPAEELARVGRMTEDERKAWAKDKLNRQADLARGNRKRRRALDAEARRNARRKARDKK